MTKSGRTVKAVFGKVTKEFPVIEKPVPHAVIDTVTHVRGWYQDKDADKPRTCTSEYFLMTPYRGCVGKDGSQVCTFCYLPNMRGYYSTGIITLDLNYPEYVRKDLEKLKVAFPAYFSPFCECFNELEDVYHLTQRAAATCLEYNVPIMFTTKRKVPEWAYKQLQSNQFNSLQVSLTTTDNVIWRKMSPGADSVRDLLNNLEKSAEKGIYTVLRIDPIIPYLTTTDDLRELVRAAVERGVDHVVVSFAEFGYAGKKKVFSKLEEMFGKSKVAAMDATYTESFGGNYIVDSKLRLSVFDMVKGILEETDVTMATCSELVKTDEGKMVGIPQYTTAISCHGIDVPVHYKHKGKFYPLDNCEGACLNCCSNACGVPRLHEARANLFSDYKNMEIEV